MGGQAAQRGVCGGCSEGCVRGCRLPPDFDGWQGRWCGEVNARGAEVLARRRSRAVRSPLFARGAAPQLLQQPGGGEAESGTWRRVQDA